MQFKLANIVLDPGDFLQGSEDLLWRSTGAPGVARAQYVAADDAIEFRGVLDLLTYFNAFSLAKWRQYTNLDIVSVHLELYGNDCDIVLARANAQGVVQRAVVVNSYEDATVQAPGLPTDLQPGVQSKAQSDIQPVTQFEAGTCADGWQSFDIPLALDDSTLVGMQLASAGTTRLRNAYFYTTIDSATQPDRIRPVRLALATTTFKKEEFIVPNIERIRTQIIESGEAIAEGFHMFVVDNGQTLDAATLSGPSISVLPNCNAGGAGGFARGMMEAQASEKDFTHIILSDDDIRVFPESFKRVHALLSLVSPAYQDALVSGAMMEMERPALFFEDVSQMSVRGSWEKIKPSIWVNTVQGVAQCETINVELPNTYAGWWFCCIPMSKVKEQGLPLPFFVRLDDVEYGLRCKSKFMTMAGICVWHEGFDARYNAVVACYQYVRNMLVVQSLHNWASIRVVMLRYGRLFRIFLRNLDYAAAELWLDGLEDYLQGPEALIAREPFEAMAAALAKAESSFPLDELPEADRAVLEEADINLGWITGEDVRPVALKALMAIPHDRHWFPERFLRTGVAMVNYDPGMSFVPWTKTALQSTLVAISPDGTRASVRRIDHDRYRALVARYRKLRAEFSKRGSSVAQEWRDAKDYLTSADFWRTYLGL